MKTFFSSLRVRLILLVLVATLPALLLTIYNGQEQRQHAETDALDNALQLAEFAASKNELLIEDTRIILISLSHAMDFAGADLSGCGHLLNHLKDVHFPFYSAFYVADLQGNILCSMPNGDLPADLLGCQHYQSLVVSEDFVISEYHLCRNTGKGVISIGYPILDSGEEKIGVINVGIDLMWFNEFAMQAELPPDSTLTVFDRDGVILAHFPDPELWVGETLPEGSIQELVFEQKYGTTRSLDVDNVERLYAFLPLSGSEESVFLMLGIPADYAFADVEKTMIRNLILIGIALFLTLTAAWFLSDAFVTRQINQLVDTTQRLASGDLSARTQSGYEQGEFGVLNRAIDDMAESLATRERERKLAEDSIREYAANLERSNRDLLDFANIASHDLQEPLRKISTFSDMLVSRYSGNLDEQANDYLDRIQSSVNRMQTLIIDLLTYSRISTKSQQLDQVDLSPIFQQVLLDLELKVDECNATIQIGDLPLINADPIQMHQLFSNLIGNSLKFYKQDTPVIIEITGGLVSTHDGRREVFDWHEIRVVDNGVGFNEKYLDRIFQPFERLHNSKEYEGNGMGLAICRKILERHGGNITAQSQPGHGATFIVRFPVNNGEGLDL